MPKKREIVQISATPETEEQYAALYVLCNDQTVFVMKFGERRWTQVELPPIPQPESNLLP